MNRLIFFTDSHGVHIGDAVVDDLGQVVDCNAELAEPEDHGSVVEAIEEQIAQGFESGQQGDILWQVASSHPGLDKANGWTEDEVLATYEYPSGEGTAIMEMVIQYLDYHDGRRYYRCAERERGWHIHIYGSATLDRAPAVRTGLDYAAKYLA